jgi:hypothetical protein
MQRGMMRHMRGPEEPAMMVGVMQQIIEKILSHEQREPIQPSARRRIEGAVRPD